MSLRFAWVTFSVLIGTASFLSAFSTMIQIEWSPVLNSIFVVYEELFRQPAAYLASLANLNISEAQLDLLVLWSIFWMPVTLGLLFTPGDKSDFEVRQYPFAAFMFLTFVPLVMIVNVIVQPNDYPVVLGGTGTDPRSWFNPIIHGIILSLGIFYSTLANPQKLYSRSAALVVTVAALSIVDRALIGLGH